MYAQAELMPWVEAFRRDVPGLDLYDAHTHVGLHDPASLLATDDELLESLNHADSRALVFPLKEPDGYEAANDRVLGLAGDRLRALCRIDPAENPLGEARRCVDKGAVGVKLHP